MVMMQPSEALDVAAQVAVTLAGFAGIVVVFRPDSVHQWSPLDRFRLHLLLTNSAGPLAYALFAILLLTLDPPPAAIWRWCSGFAFAVQVLVFVFTSRARRAVSAADFRAASKLIYYPIAALAFAAMVLQVLNYARWNRFWPFFAAIFVHLIAAILQFLRLVLLPPQKTQS
jgi:hypothetical protein